jgi:hypothetical protein
MQFDAVWYLGLTTGTLKVLFTALRRSNQLVPSPMLPIYCEIEIGDPNAN